MYLLCNSCYEAKSKLIIFWYVENGSNLLKDTYMSNLFRRTFLVFRDDSMVVKGILTKTNFDHGVIILCLDINGDNIECVGIKYHINFYTTKTSLAL